MIRSSLLVIALLVAPTAASAQYLDVIANKLNDDCSLEKYLGVVNEFRGVMKSQGYTYSVEIAQPLTGEDLATIWRIGRTKDLATFGSEYTKWETALTNPSSPESKVNKKLNACSTNTSRSGSIIR